MFAGFSAPLFCLWPKGKPCVCPHSFLTSTTDRKANSSGGRFQSRIHSAYYILRRAPVQLHQPPAQYIHPRSSSASALASRPIYKPVLAAILILKLLQPHNPLSLIRYRTLKTAVLVQHTVQGLLPAYRARITAKHQAFTNPEAKRQHVDPKDERQHVVPAFRQVPT